MVSSGYLSPKISFCLLFTFNANNDFGADDCGAARPRSFGFFANLLKIWEAYKA